MASYIGQLRPANPDETAAIKAAASESGAPGIVSAALEAAKKGLAPGSERWSVKTGADANVGQVGKVIVDTTVRELGHFKRPNQLLPATDPHTAVPRASPVETTVWRVTAHVIALKLETDGDFHLVLQHDSGSNLIAEIPLPKPNFVPKTSPFFDDIVKARDAAQKHFEPKVAATQFSRLPIRSPARRSSFRAMRCNSPAPSSPRPQRRRSKST